MKLHILHILHVKAYVICFCIFQEHDRQSGEGSMVCHRCPARLGDFLSNARLGVKNTDSRRRTIEKAASGVDLPDCIRHASSEPVVEWADDGSSHRPGPNSAHYEDARTRCGAHLVFNAFWLIAHFCVHQMLMRDGMHAIDLGVIVTLIRAILRAFLECVELILDIQGRAAAKLENRFKNVLACRKGREGQRYMQYMQYMQYMHLFALTNVICSFKGIHDCLVPVTPYLAGIFKHFRSKGKLPARVRAMDMRHVLLILPFLLHGLLTEEVEEYNRINPLVRIVDPSPMMVEITIMLLSWYRLYRRKFPAKDEDDIKDLSSLGQRSIFLHILHIRLKTAYFDTLPHITQ
jgi:hypothetical protein